MGTNKRESILKTQLKCPKCGHENYRLLVDAFTVYKVFVDDDNIETLERVEVIDYDARKHECFECGYDTGLN